jgi:hypothetical protein
MRIFYKFVNNRSHQICITICKSRLVYFTSILQNKWLNLIVNKYLSCQKISITSYKYVNDVKQYLLLLVE